MSTEIGEVEAPQPRAFWSGTISFGLVSIPVELFAAVRHQRASMRMLGPDGHPLVRRYVCSKDGRALDRDHIVRGYPRDDGGFVVISDDELSALEPDKSHDINLLRFVAREEIEPMLLDRPYILAPAGQSSKAYHLLVEVMQKTNEAGIATFVMRGAEYLVAIFAERGLLRAETLRYRDELRTPEEVGLPPRQEAPAERRKEMEKSIAALEQEELDTELLRDTSSAELIALAERKRAESRDIVEVPELVAEDDDEEYNVIDIMSLLKQRIGAASAPPAQSEARAVSADPLSRASKQELYERAKELEIPGRSRMTKQELLVALRRAG